MRRRRAATQGTARRKGTAAKPARGKPSGRVRSAGTSRARRGLPEDVARAAVGHEPAAALGDKVRLDLSVLLDRDQAERLTARAIREGKNLEALVAEILEATSAEG